VLDRLKALLLKMCRRRNRTTPPGPPPPEVVTVEAAILYRVGAAYDNTERSIKNLPLEMTIGDLKAALPMLDCDLQTKTNGQEVKSISHSLDGRQIVCSDTQTLRECGIQDGDKLIVVFD